MAVSMHTEPPRTLIHNDVQGNNLLVAEDGESSLAVVDWQLTTGARPVSDLARFRRLFPTRPPSPRGSTIADLPLNVERAGVTDYSLEQCRDDYRMALVLPASRLATGVGMSRRDSYTWWLWNVVFPRYAWRWPTYAWANSFTSATAR